MSLSTSHIHVQTEDAESLVRVVTDYCVECAATFFPHKKYRLDGVEQILRCLVRRKGRRDISVSGPSKGWCIVREQVEYSEFADPAIAQYLSKQFGARSIWCNFDDNYNIWAFQVFNVGNIESEFFEPSRYFLGAEPEDADLDAWGDCHSAAKAFNKKWQLPQFLCTPAQIARQSRLRLPTISVRIKIRSRRNNPPNTRLNRSRF